MNQGPGGEGRQCVRRRTPLPARATQRQGWGQVPGPTIVGALRQLGFTGGDTLVPERPSALDDAGRG
ncbi:hypothetical protein [Streptomyces sp. NPDC017202]|uniref:hypothetical protein n=1 Tax=Streptomyces sp. NPDC017202 TaxID=3364981 RepID=UPI0037AB47C2